MTNIKDILKYIKNISNEDNKTILIGLLTLLIITWVILYLIPDLFISLFNTLLGNIILILIALVIGMNNFRYGIITSILFIVLYRFSQLSNSSTPKNINSMKENFQLQQDKLQEFIKIQHTINPHIIFDTEKLKEQVNEEDLDYFLKNGRWYWSPEVEKLYTEASNTNPYIRTWSQDSINYASRIYNEKAILQIIALQTKEGEFLTKGINIQENEPNKLEDLPSGWGNYGYKSGLITKMNDVVKCKIDAYGNNSTLERIHHTGKGGILNEQTKQASIITNYSDLSSLIPGFKFVNKPCNPCVAVNSQPEYTCPFELDISGNNINKGISNVWKYLWGLNNNQTSQSEKIQNTLDEKEFPLLSELKKELDNIDIQN